MWIAIILGSIGLTCIGMMVVAGIFGLRFFNRAKSDIGCMMGYGLVQASVLRYAKDHNRTLPNAASWQDDVTPYYSKIAGKLEKDAGPLKDMTFPAHGDWACRDGSGRWTSICFNDLVSGVKLGDVKDPDATVMLFEAPGKGHNRHAKYDKPPKEPKPTVFGQPRPWLVFHVSGRSNSSEGGTNFSIDDSKGDSDSGDKSVDDPFGEPTKGSKSKSAK